MLYEAPVWSWMRMFAMVSGPLVLTLTMAPMSPAPAWHRQCLETPGAWGRGLASPGDAPTSRPASSSPPPAGPPASPPGWPAASAGDSPHQSPSHRDSDKMILNHQNLLTLWSFWRWWRNSQRLWHTAWQPLHWHWPSWYRGCSLICCWGRMSGGFFKLRKTNLEYFTAPGLEVCSVVRLLFTPGLWVIQHCECFLFVEVCQVMLIRGLSGCSLSLPRVGVLMLITREDCSLTWSQFLHFVCTSTKDGAGHSSCTFFLYTLIAFHNTFVCIDNKCLFMSNTVSCIGH